MAPASKKKGGKSVQKCIRKLPFKPRGKNGARFVVKSIQSSVEEVIVSYCYRSSDPHSAAFVKPLIDAYCADIDTNGCLSDQWNVHYISSRRALEGNVSMKANSDSSYDWDSFVSIVTEAGVGANDISENLANRFSEYKAENFDSAMFRAHDEADANVDPPALNTLLLDHDVVLILRMIYSTATKEEIMMDDDILVKFFGTIDQGKKVLNSMSKFKWESLI